MKPRDDGFALRPIVLVSFGHLVLDSYASFLAPFLPLIIDKFSLSMTLAGLLSAFLRVPSVLNPFIGPLADRLNLRRIFILAPFFTAVCMSSLGLAPNYWVLCLLLLAAGLNSSFYHVIGPSLIGRSSGNRLGKGMSLWMASGELARTLGPLMAVGAIAWLSFEGSWPLMGLGLAASGFLLWRFGQTDTTVDATDRFRLSEVWRRLRRVLIPMFFLLLSRGLVLPVVITYLPAYLVADGMGAVRAGMWLVALEVFGTAGAFMGGTLSDRLGRRRILALGLGISPLALVAFVHAGTGLRYALLPVLGISAFSTSAVLLAMLQDHSRRYRSTATGLYMGSVFGIAALALVAAGGLVDLAGFDRALEICAGAALLCLPALFFLPPAPAEGHPGGHAGRTTDATDHGQIDKNAPGNAGERP